MMTVFRLPTIVLHVFKSYAYTILTWSLIVVFTVACDSREEIDILAEDYVKTVLNLNELSEGELDSYLDLWILNQIRVLQFRNWGL